MSILESPRTASPLCNDEYRLSFQERRRVVPPNWMRLGIGGSVVLTIVVMAVTLLSPMDEYVSATGYVRPAEFQMAFSRTAGLLEAVEAEDGTVVQKGQVLARLDGWEIRKELADVEGQIRQAEAERALAQATQRKIEAVPVPPEFLFSAVQVEGQEEIQALQKDYYDRLDQLKKTGAASGVEMMKLQLQLIETGSQLKRNRRANELFQGDYGDAAKAEAADKVSLADAKLQSLRTKRETILGDLSRLEVLAPADGVVLATVRRLPGERVEAGAALFKISSTPDAPNELRLYATEDRVNLIQPGQAVRFRANNNPDRLAPFALGRVLAVARERDTALVDTDADTPPGAYRVSVAIEKSPYELALGATVNAEIILSRRPFWRLLFMKRTPSG